MRKQIPFLVGEVTGDVVEGQDTVLEGYDTSIRYHNCYFDTYKGALEASSKVDLVKRPGISGTAPFATPALLGTNSRITDGISLTNGGIFLVWSYENGATSSIQLTLNTAVFAAPAGWTTTYSYAEACELDYSTMANNYAFIFNGTNGGLFTGAAFNRITDADFPTNVISAVYMDGYIFAAQSGNRIYNCDLNTPSSWTATGYITATGYPGNIMGLQRLGRYVVAFKSGSIEFFENQGNPTPGSPLGPVKQLTKTVGALNPAYIRRVSDGVIFLGRGDNGALSFYKLREDDMSLQKISDQYVDGLLTVAGVFRFIGPASGLGQSKQSGTFVLPWKGHEFYSIAYPEIDGLGSLKGFNLVYDNSTGMWVTWSRNVLGVHYPIRSNAGPLVYYGSNDNTSIYLAPDSILDGNQTMPRLISETTWEDYGATEISVYWVSPRLNFGTDRRKFMSYMSVLYSAGGYNSGGSPGVLHMYYWDDHGAEQSLLRQATLTDSANQMRIVWRRLGSFRERKIVLYCGSNLPLRLKALEVDLNMAEDDVD